MTGLPPGNDKIRGALSTAANFVPQKKIFNLGFFFFFKSVNLRKSGSPAVTGSNPADLDLQQENQKFLYLSPERKCNISSGMSGC